MTIDDRKFKPQFLLVTIDDRFWKFLILLVTIDDRFWQFGILLVTILYSFLARQRGVGVIFKREG